MCRGEGLGVRVSSLGVRVVRELNSSLELPGFRIKGFRVWGLRMGPA